MSYNVHLLFDAPLDIDTLAVEVGAALGLSLRANDSRSGPWFFRKILGVHLTLECNRERDNPEISCFRYEMVFSTPVANAARTYQFEMAGIVTLRLFEWFRDHCGFELKGLVMAEDKQILARICGKQEGNLIRMFDEVSGQIVETPKFFMDFYPEQDPWT